MPSLVEPLARGYADLDERVEAFEAAHQCNGVWPVDLAPFLPSPGDPEYLSVLRELVCVDLEYGWERGKPTPLEQYRLRFPDLFADEAAARAVVWEEYRQRRQAGEEPDTEDYRRRFGVNPLEGRGQGSAQDGETPADRPPTAVVHGDWASRLDAAGSGAISGAADVYRAARRSDPVAAERYARAMACLPKVGDEFAGFRLEAELGRGAFGRVFLARQTDLADRPVALKVSAELFGEEQTLARLHHTNIVEIYSRHQVGPVQAVCMPYEGNTTLADVFKALGKTLPASGKYFASTLHGRKNSTVRGSEHTSVAPDGTDSTTSPAPLPRTEQVDKACSTEALAALERLSYPEAVLWLAAKLAEGLAHAHERGVVHRDLKPANILLTDDGQPMLIDFNLADASVLRGSEAGARVGGTLPYMAPEQIRAFHRLGDRRAVDGRSDIYSLGLILFELLSGRMAYPTPADKGHTGVARMLADRALPPKTRLRALNPAVSPAVEAIIGKCLQPDPARRYQSARELQEDIERHLRHEPLKHLPEPSLRERLRKWSARHPRLTSGTAVAALAAGLLVALAIGALALRGELRRRDAASGLQDLLTKSDAVKPRLIRSLDAERGEAAVAAARQVVAGYGVFDRPDWQAGSLVSYLPPADRDRLRGRIGELLLLLAQAAADKPDRAREALRLNDLAAACFAESDRPQAWWEQRAKLFAKLGDTAEAGRAAGEAKRQQLRTPTDHYLRALQLYEEQKYGHALPLLVKATADDPQHFWAWFLRGNCHFFLGQDAEALRCCSVCISLDPTQALPYFNRSRVYARIGNLTQAVADADRAAAIDPDRLDFQIEAAGTRYRLAVDLACRSVGVRSAELLRRVGAGLTVDHKARFGEVDKRLTAILRKPDAPPRCYFMRADARRLVGDTAGAAADIAEGFAREPAADDYLSWMSRGLKWDEKKDWKRALSDYRRAEAINPRAYAALRGQAHVLTEIGRHEESLAVLDRLLAMFPDYVEGHSERAVVLARLGRKQEALKDAEWVKAHSATPLMMYQVAGVYSLTGDTREALRLLAIAFVQGVGFEYVDIDAELNPIRNLPEFVRLVGAARTLQAFLNPAAPPADRP